MKKNDFILIISVLVICILIITGVRLIRHTGKHVSISCDGSVVGSYPLDSDSQLNIPYDRGGYNIITIKDNKVSVSDSDCPDKICVNHPPISLTDETIVCLPHKLVIKIVD